MNGEKKGDAIVLSGPTLPDAANLRSLATDLLNSDFFKNVQKAPQAVAIILYGNEIGLSPTVALNTIAIVSGRMCVSTTVLQALFQARGGKIKVVERGEERAIVEFSRPGWDPYKHEYTRKDAEREQLWAKDGWVKRPKTMLLYRCISGGLRVYDPGSFMGIVTTEEAEDFPAGINEPIAEPEKEAKKGPGRPKAEKPAPVAGEAPETPAPVKPAPVPAAIKPPLKPMDGFEVSEDPGDEIANMAEHSESASEEEILVNKIKAGLEEADVDIKAFKEWLFDRGPKMGPPRKFIVKMKNSLRFHGADIKDLTYLESGLPQAISMFRYATKAEDLDDKK